MSNAQAPHVHHAADVAFLDQEIEFLTKAVSANPLSADARGKLDKAVLQRKHTAARIPHAERAAAFVATLGLSDEVSPDAIAARDAINFVAKALHEQERGETRSHYTRAHAHLRGAVSKSESGETVAHCDDARLAQPYDPAADVIDHLALKDPAHVASARALFTAPMGV